MGWSREGRKQPRPASSTEVILESNKYAISVGRFNTWLPTKLHADRTAQSYCTRASVKARSIVKRTSADLWFHLLAPQDHFILITCATSEAHYDSRIHPDQWRNSAYESARLFVPARLGKRIQVCSLF